MASSSLEPRGMAGKAGDTFHRSTGGWGRAGATSTWAEARDTAKHPAVRGTDPTAEMTWPQHQCRGGETLPRGLALHL